MCVPGLHRKGKYGVERMKLQCGGRKTTVADETDAEEVATKLENLYHDALNCSRNLKLLSSSPLLVLNNSAQRKVWFTGSLFDH